MYKPRKIENAETRKLRPTYCAPDIARKIYVRDDKLLTVRSHFFSYPQGTIDPTRPFL